MKNGFTLLEVLIALLAAALISIMSFDFLSNTIFLKERIDDSISNNSKHSKAIHSVSYTHLTLPTKPFV